MIARILIENIEDGKELGEIISKIEDEFCVDVEILQTYDEDEEDEEEDE